MRLIYIFIVLFLVGCSSKSSYIFPTASTYKVANTKVQIGVKKVELPSYVDRDKILIKEGSKVTESDANFVDLPSELLTNRVITILKESLNNPNVLLYPWDVKSKKGYIVEIHLDKFMYDSGYAVVEGSYYIKRADGSLVESKNFRVTKPTKKEPQSIVKALSELFDSVVLEIAKKIAK